MVRSSIWHNNLWKKVNLNTKLFKYEYGTHLYTLLGKKVKKNMNIALLNSVYLLILKTGHKLIYY